MKHAYRQSPEFSFSFLPDRYKYFYNDSKALYSARISISECLELPLGISIISLFTRCSPV